MLRKRVVSPEYAELMRRIQHEAQTAMACATKVLCHRCADCGSIVVSPRVYCKACEVKGCIPSGRGSSKNPRGMLIFYGYERFDG